VNSSEKKGGAARAAKRLQKGLKSIGVKSEMLVLKKDSNDPDIIGPKGRVNKALSLIRPSIDKYPLKNYPDRSKTLFSPAWVPFSGILKKINSSDADIVHLHWINSGMIRIEEIAKINKPIVWSLHDMWPFTGGCHNDEHCGRYENTCCKCPVLNSSKEKDLSNRIFKRKEKTYKNLNLTVVGLSNWLTYCAKSSRLFKNKIIVNLPNPIDVELFKPLNKKYSRSALNIPREKKMILFGAMNAASDPNKGFEKICEALNLLNNQDIELMILGADKHNVNYNFKFPVHYFGTLSDDLSLKIIYSAADVTVVPSYQENLSNTIMESMSCGTPVVAFNIGGNGDMIDHKTNGYLSTPYESSDLANGINWVLDHNEENNLSEKSRKKILNNFEASKVSADYLKLYKDIIKQSN